MPMSCFLTACNRCVAMLVSFFKSPCLMILIDQLLSFPQLRYVFYAFVKDPCGLTWHLLSPPVDVFRRCERSDRFHLLPEGIRILNVQRDCCLKQLKREPTLKAVFEGCIIGPPVHGVGLTIKGFPFTTPTVDQISYSGVRRFVIDGCFWFRFLGCLLVISNLPFGIFYSNLLCECFVH